MEFNHKPSRQAAIELTQYDKTLKQKYERITDFVERNFVYDYIRAITIPKKNGKPNVDRTWVKRMGVCIDISAMTTGMLRAVGIDAKMCVGRANGRRHAWVECKIDGEKYLYDHRSVQPSRRDDDPKPTIIYKAEQVF